MKPLSEFGPTDIFVFGSNLKGIHGMGSALEAVRTFGAVRGRGIGRQGRSYAIPTKATPYKVLDDDTIIRCVREFLGYATQHPELTFHVVEIGCGLAGLTPADMAPLFSPVPPNVLLPESFKVELGIVPVDTRNVDPFGF